MSSENKFAVAGKSFSLAAAALALATLASCGTGTGESQNATAVVDANPSAAPEMPNPPKASTGPTAAAPEEPPLGTVSSIPDGSRIPMPLDPYMTPMSDLKTLAIARDKAAAKCMSSLGFQEWTATTIRTWDSRHLKEADLLEPLNSTTAGTAGYTPAVVEQELSGAADEAVTRRQPTAVQMKAYDGTAAKTDTGRAIPQGGCSEHARHRVYGDTTELPADPRALAVTSRSFAIGDSRVRKAITAWSACMAKNGLHYDSPAAARYDLQWATRDPATTPSDQEKRVAAIDANCQKDSNVVGMYKAARVAYEERLVAENKSKLLAGRPIFEKWVKNAESIIAG
ncbi:hypothetical protein ACFYOK_33605 [Microbispora bryophytorum]|uniref:hypothetical protein n=1 Tax=Microbispora bryophytorum TaxID=1460882 RepID=UPI00340913A6